MAWTVHESPEAQKMLEKAPKAIIARYFAWRTFVEARGIFALRTVRGFHDEALSGQWQGFRSSRLNRQWRVIYRHVADQVVVFVERISPHNY